MVFILGIFTWRFGDCCVCVVQNRDFHIVGELCVYGSYTWWASVPGGRAAHYRWLLHPLKTQPVCCPHIYLIPWQEAKEGKKPGVSQVSMWNFTIASISTWCSAVQETLYSVGSIIMQSFPAWGMGVAYLHWANWLYSNLFRLALLATWKDSYVILLIIQPLGNLWCKLVYFWAFLMTKDSVFLGLLGQVAFASDS